MSEFINNREYHTDEKTVRQQILNQIFKNLHNGKNVEEIKAYFDKNIDEPYKTAIHPKAYM